MDVYGSVRMWCHRAIGLLYNCNNVAVSSSSSAAVGLLQGQLARLEKELAVQNRLEEKLSSDITDAEWVNSTSYLLRERGREKEREEGKQWERGKDHNMSATDRVAVAEARLTCSKYTEVQRELRQSEATLKEMKHKQAMLRMQTQGRLLIEAQRSHLAQERALEQQSREHKEQSKAAVLRAQQAMRDGREFLRNTLARLDYEFSTYHTQVSE